MKNQEKSPVLRNLAAKVLLFLFISGSFFLNSNILSAQQFPYEATVCEAEAFVRSGPGKDFYATDRLQNGDKVQVFKHTADGWCAIRPPLGSFSLVSARYVQMAQNDLGQIIGNSVPIYVGSRLSPDHSQIQISLSAGKIVEILEAPSENTLEDLYRISPPSGEFRWIHGKYLSPNLTGVTQEPEPPVRFVLGNSSGIAPLPNADPNGGGMLNPGNDPNSTTEKIQDPNSFLHLVNQLDADLSYILAKGNSAQWETEALLMRANRLMNRASTVAERNRLEHVRQKIIEADGVRLNRIRFQKILATANEDGITPINDGSETASRPQSEYAGVSEFPAPYSTRPGIWDYSGILVRVQKQKYTHLSLPKYAIVNEDGLLRCYVTPMPGIDLEPHVKKRVALSGERNYVREQRAFNLNVQTIVNVW